MPVPSRRQVNGQCPAGTQWYTCARPQFRGCCTVDACAVGGCPSESSVVTEDGRPTSRLDIPTLTAAPGEGDSTSTIIPTLTSSEERPTPTVFVTVTQTPTPTSIDSDSDSDLQKAPSTNSKGTSPAAPIAGGVIGGVVGFLILFFLGLLWYRRRRTRLREAATLPPPYVDKDMSAQLGSAATSAESSSDEKGIARRPMVEREPDPVPHLDSEVVRPTLELGGGPLGCIPELPDTTRDPERAPKEKDVTRRKSQLREEGFEHVMSWSDPSALNSPERRNSRLSQPHNSPDTTVWENMVMARQREEQARRDTMDIAVHGAPLSDPSERVAVRDFGRNRRSQIRSRASSRSSTPTE